MASFPSEAAIGDDQGPADSSVAFALQELTACWNQAYEAMTRGGLQTVAGLLDQAEMQLAAAGDGQTDSAKDAALRSQAVSAHGRLRHAMRAGLDSIRDELGKTRRGQKALRGYGGADDRIGGRIAKSV